jgi:ABC-2 type transport system permease protein
MTVTSVDGIVRVQARPAGFTTDLVSVAQRAVRQIPRDPESVIPAVLVPAIFYIMNVGALSGVTHAATGIVFKAFALPVSVIFAVTGVSRASSLVLDIQNGYFDRLTITPIRRLPLLLGLMMADFALVMALSVPVILLGLAIGVRFATGLPGMLAFIVIAGCWGVVFTGLPYSIALKTGNPSAVNSSFILFFPFVFLTTAFAPLPALAGWMQAIAHYNPMTYVLAGLRSLIGAQSVPGQIGGWHWGILGAAALAIVIFGAFSMTLALLALRGRVRQR